MIDPGEEVSLTRRPSSTGPEDGIRAAVLAALLMGKPVVQIAAQYNLSRQIVHNWAQDFAITNPLERRDQLSEKMLVLVESEIESLLATSLTTRDEDWILDQDADSLAQYLAVKQNFLLGVLAAYGRVTEQRNQIAAQIVEEDEGNLK